MQQSQRSLFFIFYVLFFDSFGYALTFPLFPTLFLDPSLGILPEVTTEAGRNLFLGLLLTIFPLAQFFGAPFFGNIADQYGRKIAFRWTITGTFVGYILIGVAIVLKLYWLILFGKFLSGFFSANLVICLTVIADIKLDKKEKGKNMGLLVALIGIGWTLAIIASSLLTNPYKIKHLYPPIPFWIAAFFLASSLFILKKFYRETLIIDNKAKQSHFLKRGHGILYLLKQKPLRILYFALFFWFLGFSLSLTWIAPISIEKFRATDVQITRFFISLGICWIFASGFANRWLIEYSSFWKMSLWSLFLISLFFFFSAASDFFFYFAASYVLAGIFIAMMWGNFMSLISITATQENQGKSFGIGQSLIALSQMLSPLIGGIIAGFSIEPIFFICSLFIFIAFLLILVYVARRKQRLVV